MTVPKQDSDYLSIGEASPEQKSAMAEIALAIKDGESTFTTIHQGAKKQMTDFDSGLLPYGVVDSHDVFNAFGYVTELFKENHRLYAFGEADYESFEKNLINYMEDRDKVELGKLMEFVQQFETSKMPGGANEALELFVNLIFGDLVRRCVESGIITLPSRK